jgi:mannose-6-phosphate isomerase-like protein (cupin superfamily)
MTLTYHRDRPLIQDFANEPWRFDVRLIVNRSAGANTLSIWTVEATDKRRTPLHWHDVEEVLVFQEVDGDAFVRIGDRDYRLESDTSVVVPPGTMHSFGLRGPGLIRAISVLPDPDAEFGHRLFEPGQEPADLPPLSS